MTQQQLLKKQWFFLFIPLLISFPLKAHWQWGLGIGFGGTGVEKQVETEELGRTVAKKSEGPGMFHIVAETLWGPRFVIGFEHSRGFRMGPFSTGIGFTSATLRWHYLGAAIQSRRQNESVSLFVKKWSPYTGGSFGLAAGTVNREGDQVPSVSASGVHFGLKNGVDYAYRPGMNFRWEVSYSTTFFQAQTFPATLSEFSLWMGFLFPLF
jgi:hypothetical protein